ncbi:MAG: hypothetical protein OWS74_02410 [Firmicutes bacterium]|nr:hypothetical protein [Bacillota bacterium]
MAEIFIMGAPGVHWAQASHSWLVSPEVKRLRWVPVSRKRVALLNNSIFAILGGSWYRPPQFVQGWSSRPALSRLQEPIQKIFNVRDGVVMITDFRLALTLPFWQQFTAATQAIVVISSPFDTVSRVARQRQIEVEQGWNLWLWYTAFALLNSRQMNRAIILLDENVEPPTLIDMAEWFFDQKEEEDAAPRLLGLAPPAHAFEATTRHLLRSDAPTRVKDLWLMLQKWRDLRWDVSYTPVIEDLALRAVTYPAPPTMSIAYHRARWAFHQWWSAR